MAHNPSPDRGRRSRLPPGQQRGRQITHVRQVGPDEVDRLGRTFGDAPKKCVARQRPRQSATRLDRRRRGAGEANAGAAALAAIQSILPAAALRTLRRRCCGSSATGRPIDVPRGAACHRGARGSESRSATGPPGGGTSAPARQPSWRPRAAPRQAHRRVADSVHLSSIGYGLDGPSEGDNRSKRANMPVLLD